ncbi:MAG: hypothetical protein HPY66_2951 [Firmicutes bacterium]|nr:hypothetical protein [Bacillota bacterium]
MKGRLVYTLKDERGSSVVGYVVVAPFLLWFFMYLVLGGAYFMRRNDMVNLINTKFDRALLEGQFTAELKAELVDGLSGMGFEREKLEIEVTPEEAFDGSDETYVPRGREMGITVLYRSPHPFYYINRVMAPGISEQRFYIGARVTGMSEKW